MSNDFETLDSTFGVKKSKLKEADDDSDFPSMFVELIKKINWKIGFFLMLIGILIFSDLFIENILVKMNNAVEADCPTNKGTLIQLLTFVLSYIFVDLLVQAEIL